VHALFTTNLLVCLSNTQLLLVGLSELLFSQLLVLRVSCSCSWMLVPMLRALLSTVEKTTTLRLRCSWLQQQVSSVRPQHTREQPQPVHPGVQCL